MAGAHEAFDVWLGTKLIDTVFANPGSYTIEEMRRSLIDHDGYDPRIRVSKPRAQGKPGNPSVLSGCQSCVSQERLGILVRVEEDSLLWREGSPTREQKILFREMLMKALLKAFPNSDIDIDFHDLGSGVSVFRKDDPEGASFLPLEEKVGRISEEVWQKWLKKI